MTQQFKAGDTVRAKENVHGITAGKHYRLSGAMYNFVDIEADDFGLPAKGWFARRFELVTPAEPPRECIVAIKTGTGAAPSYRPVVHPNRTKADQEAQRLAEANPGAEFAIYERVGAFKADKPVAVRVA